MKVKSKESTPAEPKSKSIARGRKPTGKAKKKKKLAGNDPAKPKKPPTAFFYFLEDFRKIYQKENPDVKSMSEIGKVCGMKWKTMTYEDCCNVEKYSGADTSQGTQHENSKYIRPIGSVGKTSCCHTLQEKVAYYDVATEKRAEFEKAMSDYLKRKESGDLSDESDD